MCRTMPWTTGRAMVLQLRSCWLVSPPTATPSAWLPPTQLLVLLPVDPELLDLSPVRLASGPTMRFEFHSRDHNRGQYVVCTYITCIPNFQSLPPIRSVLSWSKEPLRLGMAPSRCHMPTTREHGLDMTMLRASRLRYVVLFFKSKFLSQT